MWILSGFADEIDPDLSTQCWVLDELAKSRPRAVADASDTSGRRRP